jgi:hypothetical protein
MYAVLSAVIILAAIAFGCWFMFVITRAAFTAESYAPPCDHDGGPDYAAVDYWSGRYPGGRNDPHPPAPPTDYPGRIAN